MSILHCFHHCRLLYRQCGFKIPGIGKFSLCLKYSHSDRRIIYREVTGDGFLFGLVGSLFAYGLVSMKSRFRRTFHDPVKKIAIVSIFLAILFILLGMGRYSGLGTNLISAGFHGGRIYGWDWILKFVLTIITIAAGFQGGEVTPLFAIGTSLGAAVAGILGLPLEFVAAMGYAAVFGSATNTLLAPVFIGAEVFGYSYMPYFFVVCSIAYLFNGDRSINCIT